MKHRTVFPVILTKVRIHWDLDQERSTEWMLTFVGMTGPGARDAILGSRGI
jgi:hypothetical protein